MFGTPFLNYAIPGIYSGLFAMYLLHHKESDNAKPNIIFYTLCVLYVLSMAVVAIDIAILIPVNVINFFLTWG